MPRSTGDEVLDGMLGGGVPDGRTLLVRGPSGVGKSRLAGGFLAAGAADGEDCLYVTTDEPPDVASAGLGLADEVTVAAVHLAEGSDGIAFATADGVETVPYATVIDRLSRADRDRVVVDGVTGLVALAPDRARGRRALVRLLRRLDDHDATAVLTATDAGPPGVDRVVHGVLSCWREEIEGDSRRFCRVAKLRGHDHDTRRHALAAGPDGVSVAPREWASHVQPFRTGIDSFDELAGGFVRGGTTVFEHTGTADHWPFTASLCARALEQDVPLALVTAPGTLLNRVDALLADRVGSVRELMERNQLFLIDPISQSEQDRVVAGLPSENVLLQATMGSLQEAMRTLVDRLAGSREEAVTVLEGSAIHHLVSDDQAQQLYYWASGSVLAAREELSLVLSVDEEVAGTRLSSFLTGVADQVVRTWRGEDELQYLSVPKSPAGTPGHTRVVEPREEPPYVRLR